MALILLDSSVIFDHLNGRFGRPAFLQHLLQQGHEFACCPVNFTEVYAGLRPGEEESTAAFLDSLEFLPVTAAIPRDAGVLRRDWRSKGVTLSYTDVTIAAVALANNVPLATDNRRHPDAGAAVAFSARYPLKAPRTEGEQAKGEAFPWPATRSWQDTGQARCFVHSTALLRRGCPKGTQLQPSVSNQPGIDMAMLSGGNRHRRAEINVTPLIDVLLVLLIIFMVITPLSEHGLKAVVPQPPRDDRHYPAVPDDIVITVRADKTVLINQEQVAMANLADRLAQLFRTNLNHPLFLRADAGLEFRQIAEVIDIARGAGLTRVALMPSR